MMRRFAIIMPAAGSSSRFGASSSQSREKKVFANLNGEPVWLWSAKTFLKREDVAQIVVVIAPDDIDFFRSQYGPHAAFYGIDVAEGGNERVDSVANGIAALGPESEYVAIHDAARPCLTSDRIDAVFQAAIGHGAAALGVPVTDTLKRADKASRILETVPRDRLWAIQTPQVFRRDLIERAFAERHRLAEPVTDDLRLAEALGAECVIVPGSRWNLKITTRDDLELARAILGLMRQPAATHA